MVDKLFYTMLHVIMRWAGKLNSWAWCKHVKILRKEQEKEAKEYLKELKKKL